MTLTLIVAMGSNRIIGRGNSLPWRLPADLRHFKSTTMGHPIIMGRKTYESIGRALPGRTNIIITAKPRYTAAGCHVANSIDEALELAQTGDQVFIIGGASLYAQTLSRADRLYVTLIHHEFEGDAYFPEIDSGLWRKMEEESFRADQENPYDYSFLKFERSA